MWREESGNHSIRLVAILVVTAVLSGCSYIMGSPVDQNEMAKNILSVEVYLARASLFETEFEQFKIIDNQLYIECGEIRRGRQRPQYQSIIDLDSDTRGALIERTAQFYYEFKTTQPTLEEPGDLSNFADDGQLYLTINGSDDDIEVRTAFDPVVYSNGRVQSLLSRLLKELRDVAKSNTEGNTLCGNVTFYGLGGRSNLS